MLYKLTLKNIINNTKSFICSTTSCYLCNNSMIRKKYALTVIPNVCRSLTTLHKKRSILKKPINASKKKEKPNEDFNIIENIVVHKGEIKDAMHIFELAWSNIIDKYGDENLIFPKEIMFLAGAPGAGKGEMTDFIKSTRGITSETIETSKLLISKEAKGIMSKGGLVASRHVVQLLLQKLLDPSYSSGVIVDGFPRTKIQGECIKLLYNKMRDYKRKYENTKIAENFKRPLFHITVLFIEEELSIQRQLSRGDKVRAHNRRVKETGYGKLIPLRETDVDPSLAKQRYRLFNKHIYESLRAVKDYFNFHFINADSTVDVVKHRILKELKYQSSLELDETTFEKLRKIPLASEIIRNARYNLVKRLDTYSKEHSELLDRVVVVLKNEFIDSIFFHALSGKVAIRSENTIFKNPLALKIINDILTERGYTTVVDIQRVKYPVRIEENGSIIVNEKIIYEFMIKFQKPEIRHSERFIK